MNEKQHETGRGRTDLKEAEERVDLRKKLALVECHQFPAYGMARHI